MSTSTDSKVISIYISNLYDNFIERGNKSSFLLSSDYVRIYILRPA